MSEAIERVVAGEVAAQAAAAAAAAAAQAAAQAELDQAPPAKRKKVLAGIAVLL